jgi:hypothetical protein
MTPYQEWVQRVGTELGYPGPLKKGDKGRGVKNIQEWINLLGWSPGLKIDGIFGPATEQALIITIKSNTLHENGWKFLTDRMRNTLAYSDNQSITHIATRYLTAKAREVGGQNRGPWVRLFMNGMEGTAWPWCAGFVSHVRNQHLAMGGRKLPSTYATGCSVFAKEFQDCIKSKPREPGSIFLIEDRNDKKRYVHMGIVTAINKDTFVTIEGNTNDYGSPEGYEVCHRIRSYSGKKFIDLPKKGEE